MVMTSQETVTSIEVLTEKSEMAQGPASQIDIQNFSMASNGFGPIPVRLTAIILLFVSLTTL